MPSNHPKEDEKPVEPERDEPDQVMVPEILVHVENKPVLESAAPCPTPQTGGGGGWEGVAYLTSTYTVLILFTP